MSRPYYPGRSRNLENLGTDNTVNGNIYFLRVVGIQAPSLVTRERAVATGERKSLREPDDSLDSVFLTCAGIVGRGERGGEMGRRSERVLGGLSFPAPEKRSTPGGERFWGSRILRGRVVIIFFPSRISGVGCHPGFGKPKGEARPPFVGDRLAPSLRGPFEGEPSFQRRAPKQKTDGFNRRPRSEI